MTNWKPIDFIVAVFAITVAVIMASIVFNVIYSGVKLSDDEADRVSVIISAMISVISMYMGAAIQKNRDK